MNHSLTRTVWIQASRDVVFGYFTGDERWARWWGAGSSIDARPGGAVIIRYPGGVVALGEVLEIDSPERIVFTYGYASGQPIPPGSSRVTIRLAEQEGGTRVELVHDFDDAAVRDQHVQGWRYQLSVFANVAADEVFASAGQIVDAWFGAWAETDAGSREAAFASVTASDVRFRDRYSAVEGVEEVAAHAGAAQKFMPGIGVARTGDVRHCQGMVLAQWVAAGPDGVARMRGTNVFELNANGKIAAVTGFIE